MSRLIFTVLLTLALPVVCLAKGGGHGGGSGGGSQGSDHSARPTATVSAIKVTDKAGTVTITGTDGSTKDYQITSFTRITINGFAAKLSDIHTGMKVSDIEAGGDTLYSIDFQ